MSTNDEKVCLKVRLTEEEKVKLEHDAALCGLTLGVEIENAPSGLSEPITMPRSQERTSDFSVQREVMPNRESQQKTAYCVRHPTLRVSTKKRHAGAVLFADFTWIEIEDTKRAARLTQTARGKGFRELLSRVSLQMMIKLCPHTVTTV